MSNLAIIFGGKSVEHDVSIVTGVQVLSIAKTLPYKVIPIYIKNDCWYTGNALYDIEFYKQFDDRKLQKVYLQDGKLYKKGVVNRVVTVIDIVLLATHGGEGENGQLQAVLSQNNIPVASTAQEGSSITANKLYATILAENLFIDVVPYMSICAYQKMTVDKMIPRIIKNLGEKIIVKPTHLGSSIGITVAEDAVQLKNGIDLAFQYDTDVICMECVNLDYELNIALYEYDGKIYLSDIEKPMKTNKILTFEDKYLQGGKGMENMSRELPAIIPMEMSNRVRRWAKKLYQELGLTGIVRIDFLVSKGYLYFNEINTVPGSLAMYLFRDTSPDVLLNRQLENAFMRKKQDNIIRQFPSSVLSSTNFSKS